MHTPTQNTVSYTIGNPVDQNGTAYDTYVSMKGYDSIEFNISVGAMAATAAITLSQATDAAKTGAKTLSLTTYYASTTAASRWVKTTAVASTFNVAATAQYSITVNASDLDVTNGFDWVSCQVADPGAATVTAVIARGFRAKLATTADKMTLLV